MEQIHTSQLEVERARLEHERAEALTELRHTLMMSHREDMEGVESRWAERLTAMEKRLEESSQRKGKLKISNNVVLNVALKPMHLKKAVTILAKNSQLDLFFFLFWMKCCGPEKIQGQNLMFWSVCYDGYAGPIRLTSTNYNIKTGVTCSSCILLANQNNRWYMQKWLKDTGHYWLLSKTSILTCCCSIYKMYA